MRVTRVGALVGALSSLAAAWLALALVCTSAMAQPVARPGASGARTSTRAERARVAAVERGLARAEREASRGRIERALSLLDAAALRSPEDPRAALRYCALVAPETDATLETVMAAPEPTTLRVRRCVELLPSEPAEPEGGDGPVGAASRWARALLGDRAPILDRLSSRLLDESTVPRLRRIAALAASDDDLSSAARALELARRVRPGDLDLTSQLAAVRLARGDVTGALPLFQAVVAGRPGDLAALHDLAGASLQAGDPATAVRHLETLAAAEPESAERWLELARARLEQGDSLRAADDARRAGRAASAEDARPSLALGDALRLAGDLAAARAAYEDALRREPGSVRARRAIDALGE